MIKGDSMHRVLFGAFLVLTAFTSTAGQQRHGARTSIKSPTSPIHLDKRLSDFGLTPRSLATWRTTGGQPALSFFDLRFRKIERPAPGSRERALGPKALTADGQALNGFQMEGADYLAGATTYRTLGHLRLNKNGPQASKDNGRTWVNGERLGEIWAFAFDNETLTVQSTDEVFAPTEFKAWALERAAVTRMEKSGDFKIAPYFHSAVVTVAVGRNEMQGLLKFPGTTFVVPFRGLRYKDRWVARATGIAPFNTNLWAYQGAYWHRGAYELNDDHSVPQLELFEDRLILGTGNWINYGLDGDASEQLRTATEFDLRRGKPLPDLSAQYKANLARSLWTKSDEEESFSRAAERAYVATGIPVWFYPTYASNNPGSARGMRVAEACQKPLVERLQRLGARVELIPAQ